MAIAAIARTTSTLSVKAAASSPALQVITQVARPALASDHATAAHLNVSTSAQAATQSAAVANTAKAQAASGTRSAPTAQAPAPASGPLLFGAELGAVTTNPDGSWSSAPVGPPLWGDKLGAVTIEAGGKWSSKPVKSPGSGGVGGFFRKAAAIALAPVTGGVSLIGTSDSATHAVTHAAASPLGVGIIGSVIGIAAAPFTGGLSLALPALTTPLAAAWKQKQDRDKAVAAAAAGNPYGTNPYGSGPYGAAGGAPTNWLLYGGLALAVVLVIREIE